MAGLLWKPPDCGCTSGCRQSQPAWIGWPKKGAAERTPAAEEVVAIGTGGYSDVVAADRPDVCLDLACGVHSGREWSQRSSRGSSAIGRTVGGDGAAWRGAGCVGGSRCPLRACQPQLLVGPVPLL